MKVEIIKGTINNGKEVSKPGTVLDVNDKDAETLIALGMVRKSGGGKSEGTSQSGNSAASPPPQAGDSAGANK
jgi:hypothetical protein